MLQPTHSFPPIFSIGLGPQKDGSKKAQKCGNTGLLCLDKPLLGKKAQKCGNTGLLCLDKPLLGQSGGGIISETTAGARRPRQHTRQMLVDIDTFHNQHNQHMEGSTWVSMCRSSCNSMCCCVLGCMLACWTLFVMF